MCAKSLRSCPTLCNHMDYSHPGLSRQEYWSGLLCPLAGELPDPGIKSKSLMSPALASRFFTTWEVVKSTTWEAPKQNR